TYRWSWSRSRNSCQLEAGMAPRRSALGVARRPASPNAQKTPPRPQNPPPAEIGLDVLLPPAVGVRVLIEAFLVGGRPPHPPEPRQRASVGQAAYAPAQRSLVGAPVNEPDAVGHGRSFGARS